MLREGAGRFPKSADLQYRLGRLLADRGARAEAELRDSRVRSRSTRGGRTCRRPSRGVRAQASR